MSVQDKASVYLRSKVFSASPEELRLMLLDGALRFARQGREGLATKNYELSFNGLSSCKNILLELVTSMKVEVAPELCAKLRALYMFMYSRLIDANLEKSPEIVDEVVQLLEYERETWVLLMQRLEAERASGISQETATPIPVGAAAKPAPAGRTPLSIEG
ncbi:MAG: flagellar export chaperone FliS [Phycisphaerales bacterium]|nr:flagellar export chaperone FliS [Phycisphaerales bacterium]